MTDFLTTIAPNQVRPFVPAVPMLVTATGYWRVGQKLARHRGRDIIMPVVLPDHVPEVAADSGGFEAARRHHGSYPFSFDAYLRWLACIPRLTWAALPDLPCERELARTYANVRERQQLTLDWARDLWGESTEHSEYASVPWCWVATVQGRSVDDYVWMAEQMRPLLRDQLRDYDDSSPYAYDWGDPDDYDDHTRQLIAEAELGARYRRVGIGSLCKRTNTRTVVEIVRAVAEALPGQRFHLWGVALPMLEALREAGLLDRVASFDTAAWNQRFGRGLEAYRTSGLSQAAHAWQIAWPDYHTRVERILTRPRPDGRQLGFEAA